MSGADYPILAVESGRHRRRRPLREDARINQRCPHFSVIGTSPKSRLPAATTAHGSRADSVDRSC